MTRDEAERIAAEWEPNPAECEIEGAQAENQAMSAHGMERPASVWQDGLPYPGYWR